MLSNNFTETLIGLQDIIVKNIVQKEKMKEIHIEMIKKQHKCPCCGEKTDKIHDYRTQQIKDISAFGDNTLLFLRKRRYVCKNCKKKFYESVKFLPRYYRMTNRLIADILEKLEDVRSFSSVAREVNLSVSTVIRMFDLVSYRPKSMPIAIGIDEFKGNTGSEKYQCIITDIENNKVVDILPNRTKYDLIRYFKRFDCNSTNFFVSDMWETYHDISKTFFKNSTYIVDKYHYIRQVIWAIESVRKEEQKKFAKQRRIYFKHSKSLLIKQNKFLTDEQKSEVQVMLWASEKLCEAYYLKEDFFKIFECNTKQEAEKTLSKWILEAQNSGLERFVACGKTMAHWFDGILNSLEFNYSNGFTEGCNNKIKVLKRNAYGYRNFKRFRNRILHIFSSQNQSNKQQKQVVA